LTDIIKTLRISCNNLFLALRSLREGSVVPLRDRESVTAGLYVVSRVMTNSQGREREERGWGALYGYVPL